MKKIVLLSMVIAILAIAYVYALPTGPSGPIVPISSERLDSWGPQTIPALAGNITEFNTDTSSITRTWQGYFGNITGAIVLGDANNNTLYDWDLAMPQGEIFATRTASVPAWSDVACSTAAELEAEDTAMGITDQSIQEDAINRTFQVLGSPEAQARYGTTLAHPQFWVADSQVNANTCAIAYMYNATESESQYFREVILSDQASAPIIYAAFTAHTFSTAADVVGFDGGEHDFQMIVAEDGHGTDTATTLYYFYLELE